MDGCGLRSGGSGGRRLRQHVRSGRDPRAHSPRTKGRSRAPPAVRTRAGSGANAASYASLLRRVETDAVMHAAAFWATLRSLLRESASAARTSGLLPNRYLLLLMIKGAPDGS